MWKLAIWLAVLAGVILALAVTSSTKSEPLSNSVVKVVVPGGHGSATHIGNGYYVTAAHVVASQMEVQIKTSTGQAGKAEILWASTKYDIALLHSGLEGVNAARLECRTPDQGEAIEFRGNPSELEHISTWGRVSGHARIHPGFWHNAMPVDGVIAPGMSGGAVFDNGGDLVGVNVGLMMMRIGFGGSPSGIGFIVPAETVCGLMGRGGL